MRIASISPTFPFIHRQTAPNYWKWNRNFCVWPIFIYPFSTIVFVHLMLIIGYEFSWMCIWLWYGFCIRIFLSFCSYSACLLYKYIELKVMHTLSISFGSQNLPITLWVSLTLFGWRMRMNFWCLICSFGFLVPFICSACILLLSMPISQFTFTLPTPQFYPAQENYSTFEVKFYSIRVICLRLVSIFRPFPCIWM